MAYPLLKNHEFREGQLNPTTRRCRALCVWLITGLLVVVTAAGCVTTADCDEYIGCDDGEVCYQSRCLPVCEDDPECEATEVCEPCRVDGQQRCLDSEAGACVADEE